MPELRRLGYVTLTLRTGEAPRVPCQLDHLIGAARSVSRLDGGPLDRALRAHAGSFRALSVFHARRSLGRVGAQHTGWGDDEEVLGLSRTFAVQVGEPARIARLVAALRELGAVESAMQQQLCTAPFAALAAVPAGPTRAERALEPHRLVRALEAQSSSRARRTSSSGSSTPGSPSATPSSSAASSPATTPSTSGPARPAPRCGSKATAAGRTSARATTSATAHTWRA